MKRTILQNNWQFSRATPALGYSRQQTQTPSWMPAIVPGHVHVDLFNNHIIADPFAERHEAGLTWIDEADWHYKTTFEWKGDAAMPHQILRFDGLDTVAEITLNGKLIGKSDNFFLPLELHVESHLVPGENLLEIKFLSPVRTGDERRHTYFATEGLAQGTLWFDERSFIRKPGYMSGWDWGPRLVSCGIWRPITLLEYAGRITNSVVLQTPLGDGKFKLEGQATVDGTGELEMFYRGKSLGPGVSSIEVSDPLWWPHGEGESVLYDFEFRLSTGDSVVKKIGLREVKLLREPDPNGTSFEFEVNGRKIWSRGANWIPHDSFPGVVPAADIHEAIERYAKMGMNMLRVWGGGLYETDEFYDACDANGILVWQDFPYACSYYPDGKAEQAEAKREATHHVNRLKDRASLAIWCGNNENRAMWFGRWGGLENAPSRFYGEVIYDQVLKKVVQENDPSRPYVESSPLIVRGMEPVLADPATHSDDHYWDVWHGRGDWKFYEESTTRFSSEFGFASSCSEFAWRRVSDRTLTPDDPTARWHDKTNKGWETFRGYTDMHYPRYESMADWVYYSQLNQRDAMRAALEHYRGGDTCKGALIWQVNDCWPVQSWALEDYSRLTKVAGFELVRLFAPVLIAVKKREGRVDISVANDGPSPFAGELLVDVIEQSGSVISGASHPVQLAMGARSLIVTVPTAGLVPTATFIRVRLKDHPAAERWILISEPKELKLTATPLKARLSGGILEVQAEGVVLDLIVWDAENPHHLFDSETGLSGFRAVSGLDLTLKLGCHHPPAKLAARSLAGRHEIQL